MKTTRTLLLLGCAVVVGCGTAGNDDSTAPIQEATTADGTAPEGSACLESPTYRDEKCMPGLSCVSLPWPSADAKCVARHAEADACDLQFGDAGCEVGLRCVWNTSGGGFCKGLGTGACRFENGGLDCAGGYVCVDSSGGGAGKCVVAGSPNTPCDPNLVENGCQTGTSCVTWTYHDKSVCSTGEIDAPCDLQSPQTGCRTGLICYNVSGGSTFEATCQAGLHEGDYCTGSPFQCEGGLSCLSQFCHVPPKAIGTPCILDRDCGFHMYCRADQFTSKLGCLNY